MRGDQPITSKREDLLDRASFANSVAQTIRSLDATRGAVIAVLAPWGTGKTSFINMVLETLNDEDAITSVQFNPWLFSGTDQLVLRFFSEIANQIRMQAPTQERLASLLITYGRLMAPLQLVPAVAPWAQGARFISGWAASMLRQNESNSAEAQRNRIQTELRSRKSPLVVVIDDLDRLEATEIRDMVRLVRLVGNFPQVIYLLAFDRSRVEEALQREGAGGRSYLEKIVEYTFDLPPPAPAAVERILLSAINEAVAATPQDLDQARWPDVFYRVIMPLISSIRDVRRYTAILPAAFASMRDEVATTDVLALEAVRVLTPEVHSRISGLAPLLTEPARQSEASSQRLAAFIDSAGARSEAIENLCRLLFPFSERYLPGNRVFGPEWAATWRRERRVANRSVLDFYLIRTLTPGVAPARVVSEAFNSLGDERRFGDLLSTVDDLVLEDLLSRLESYEEDFSPSWARPACKVLIALYPRLKSRVGSGTFDLPAEMKIDRLVLRLLRRVPEEARSDIIQELAEARTGIYGRLRVLELAGHRSGSGNQLIDMALWRSLDSQLCDEIRHLAPKALSEEADPLVLIAHALSDDPTDRGDIDKALGNEAVLLRVLRSAKTLTTVRQTDSLVVKRIETLNWSQLVTCAGSQDRLTQLIDLLREQSLADDDRATLALTKRYLAGWRPIVPKLPFAVKIVTATSGPTTYLAPTGLSGGFPDLVLRATSSLDVEGNPPTVSGRSFHDTLNSNLRNSRFTEQLLAVFGQLDKGGPDPDWSWSPDPEVQQSRQAAATRLTLGRVESSRVVGRYALLISGPNLRTIADFYIWYSDLTPRTEAPAGQTPSGDRPQHPLELSQAVTILATEIEAVAGQLARAIVPAAFAGQWVKNPTLELHLTPRSGTETNRPRYSLEDVIDLSILGKPSGQPAYEGHAGVEIPQLFASEHEARELVIETIRRLSADWGYLDAESGLKDM